MTGVKEFANVLERLDAASVLPILADLIRFESTGGNENPAQEYVARFLQRIGAETDVWEIDLARLRTHPAFGMEIEREAPLGVVGALGDESAPSLILNGHVDVVPAGDSGRWRYPPWQATVVDDRVYGRGSCDMKGGLAAILAAVQAVASAGAHPDSRVIVQSVVGEEDGGVGTLAAVERGYRADGAIIAEPTELKIAPSSAGALSFRVRVQGRSSHGAVREEGVSAIEKFPLIHEALLALERSRNESLRDPLYSHYRLPSAISIGTIRGGNWASTVPEELVVEGRYGLAPGEDAEVARRTFEDAVATAAASDPWLSDHPPAVEWWGGQFLPASVSVDHPLVRLVVSAAAHSSVSDPSVVGMPYGSDLRLLVNEGGTPAVLFGPGDVRIAHRTDEFVPVNDLVRCSQAIALAILRWPRVLADAGVP